MVFVTLFSVFHSYMFSQDVASVLGYVRAVYFNALATLVVYFLFIIVLISSTRNILSFLVLLTFAFF